MESTYKKSDAEPHQYVYRVRMAFTDQTSKVVWVILEGHWNYYETLADVLDEAELCHGISQSMWISVLVERYSYGEQVR